MKPGDEGYITDGVHVLHVVVVLDLSIGSADPTFEVKELHRTGCLSEYFKHESEIYTNRADALRVAIASAEQCRDKAEKDLQLAKCEVRWAKHTLKQLNKELDKEETQNGRNHN